MSEPNPSFHSIKKRYWFFQIFGWGGVAAIGWVMDRIQVSLNEQSGVSEASYFLPLTCLAGLFATHCLRMVIKKYDWLNFSGLKLAIHYAVALSLLSLILGILGSLVWGEFSHEKTLMASFTSALLVNSSLVGAWMAIYFLTHFQEAFYRALAERSKLNEAYMRSQVEALTQQINPHFLFNSLNSIRALLPEDLHEARTSITTLAEILRATLQSGVESVGPLAGELELVDRYLLLQRLRFQEKLMVTQSIEPNCLEVMIPRLILLTIVENAIKHGVQFSQETSVIEISASIEENKLNLVVISPWIPKRHQIDDSLGIGLRNATERIRLIYGKHGRISTKAVAGHRFKCSIVVPVTKMFKELNFLRYPHQIIN